VLSLVLRNDFINLFRVLNNERNFYGARAFEAANEFFDKAFSQAGKRQMTTEGLRDYVTSHMQAAAKLYQAQVTEEAAKETNRILLKIELRLDQLGTLVSEAS
jgi:hypothetical protein